MHNKLRTAIQEVYDDDADREKLNELQQTQITLNNKLAEFEISLTNQMTSLQDVLTRVQSDVKDEVKDL